MTTHYRKSKKIGPAAWLDAAVTGHGRPFITLTERPALPLKPKKSKDYAIAICRWATDGGSPCFGRPTSYSLPQSLSPSDA